jgi:hypothetical protein
VCASECALASDPGAARVRIVAVCEGRDRDLNRRPREVRLVGWSGAVAGIGVPGAGPAAAPVVGEREPVLTILRPVGQDVLKPAERATPIDRPRHYDPRPSASQIPC